MTAPPLVILLAIARDELAAETPTRLHVEHTSKLEDADGRVTADEGGIGPPFTAAFHRLLSIRERPRQTEYLMRGSFEEVTEWCLRTHPTHEDGLCGRILVSAVRGRWTTVDIAFLVAYPEPAVRSMLIQALQHAANWRAARSQVRKPTAADIVIEEADRRLRRRRIVPSDVVGRERTAHGGA